MKKLYLISTIILTAIFFISLWTLDISVAAMNIPNARLIGLFGYVDNPFYTYHFALYLVIITFFLSMISIMFIIKEDKKK